MAEKAALAGGSVFDGSQGANAVPLGRASSAKGSVVGKLKGKGKAADEEEEEEEVNDEEGVDEGEMQVDSAAGMGRAETEQTRLAMSSLRNKNKKKGFFKQSMMRGLSDGSKAKIVFDGADGGDTLEQREVEEVTAVVAGGGGAEASSSVPVQVASGSSVTNVSTTKTRARLVPPSELQEMGMVPGNLFVTSVDVEEGMWDQSSSGRKNKKRKKGKGQQQYDQPENFWDGAYNADPDQFADAVEEENVTLYYDADESISVPPKAEKEVGGEVDWEKAEKGWEGWEVVRGREQVGVGVVVGWKVRYIVFASSFSLHKRLTD